MKRKRVKLSGIALVMSMLLLAGCAQKQDDVVNATVLSEDNTTEENASKEEGTIVVQVTSIDGDTITADVGELAIAAGAEGDGAYGMPGKMDGGESGENMSSWTDEAVQDGEGQETEETQSDGESGQKPLATPDGGQTPDGQKPGAMPDGGQAPDGQKPGAMPDSGQKPLDGVAEGGMGGSRFTAGGEAVSFNVTDKTEITVEFLQGSDTGTLEDIAVGSVLEVTMDENGSAETILVKNLNKGGGFGGSSEVTNGTAAGRIDSGTSESSEAYTFTGDDENALRIDAATAELTGITVEKQGEEM